MDSIQQKPKRPRVPRWVVMLITYALSLACLVWALYGYDFSEIKGDIRRVRWAWVALAIVFDLSVYVFHGWRWVTLLKPIEKLSLWRTVQAIYIGLFANEVLPLRPGEIIRCYLLAAWNKLPLSLTLTSMVMERVIDGIWLVGAFWISASLMNMPAPLVDFAQAMAGGVFVLTLVFLYVLFHKKHAHSVMSSNKWGQKFIHVLDMIHELGDWRTLLGSFGVTFFYWLLQALSIWALFRSYEMDLSIWAATVVLVVIRIGTIIPAAPGNLGVFNSVAKLALMLFLVEPGTASGFSIFLWAALTLPLLIGGFVAVFLTGVSLGDIHRHAHDHHRQHRERRETPAQH